MALLCTDNIRMCKNYKLLGLHWPDSVSKTYSSLSNTALSLVQKYDVYSQNQPTREQNLLLIFIWRFSCITDDTAHYLGGDRPFTIAEVSFHDFVLFLTSVTFFRTTLLTVTSCFDSSFLFGFTFLSTISNESSKMSALVSADLFLPVLSVFVSSPMTALTGLSNDTCKVTQLLFARIYSTSNFSFLLYMKVALSQPTLKLWGGS